VAIVWTAGVSPSMKNLWDTIVHPRPINDKSSIPKTYSSENSHACRSRGNSSEKNSRSNVQKCTIRFSLRRVRVLFMFVYFMFDRVILLEDARPYLKAKIKTIPCISYLVTDLCTPRMARRYCKCILSSPQRVNAPGASWLCATTKCGVKDARPEIHEHL
jgi:hypothetical protein